MNPTFSISCLGSSSACAHLLRGKYRALPSELSRRRHSTLTHRPRCYALYSESGHYAKIPSSRTRQFWTRSCVESAAPNESSQAAASVAPADQLVDQHANGEQRTQEEPSREGGSTDPPATTYGQTSTSAPPRLSSLKLTRPPRARPPLHEYLDLSTSDSSSSSISRPCPPLHEPYDPLSPYGQSAPANEPKPFRPFFKPHLPNRVPHPLSSAAENQQKRQPESHRAEPEPAERTSKHFALQAPEPRLALSPTDPGAAALRRKVDALLARGKWRLTAGGSRIERVWLFERFGGARVSFFSLAFPVDFLFWSCGAV